MTLSYEHFLLIFGVFVVVGLFVSFTLAAILGALSVVGLGIWARRRPAGECPQCGAKIRGATRVCTRCNHEL